jgi:hypothetical protein
MPYKLLSLIEKGSVFEFIWRGVWKNRYKAILENKLEKAFFEKSIKETLIKAYHEVIL